MRSLKTRLLAISALTIVLVLIVAAFAFRHIFAANLERRLDDELTAYVDQIAATLEFDADGTLRAPTPLSDLRFERPYSGLYWQIDGPDGARLRSRSLWDYVLPLPDDVQETSEIHRYRLRGPDGREVLVQERALIVATPLGPRGLRIATALDRTIVDAAGRVFLADLVPYLVALGVVLSLASLAQLTVGLRPLDRVAVRLLDIAPLRGQRIDGAFPAEIRRLVEAVNGLLDARESAIGEARTRAGNLAHGLKTPLTVLGNDARTLRRQGNVAMADEIETLVAQMRARIDHALALGRIAARALQAREAVSLPAIVGEVVRTLARTPAGERLTWTLDVPPDTCVALDANDLRELLGNLVENACKWATAEVRVGAREHDDRVELVVEDDGPGMPEGEIARMMTRGSRLDESLEGSGIGLDIVREIGVAYALDVRLANRLSGGLGVAVTLPCELPGPAGG